MLTAFLATFFLLVQSLLIWRAASTLSKFSNQASSRNELIKLQKLKGENFEDISKASRDEKNKLIRKRIQSTFDEEDLIESNIIQSTEARLIGSYKQKIIQLDSKIIRETDRILALEQRVESEKEKPIQERYPVEIARLEEQLRVLKEQNLERQIQRDSLSYILQRLTGMKRDREKFISKAIGNLMQVKFNLSSDQKKES